MKRPPTFLKAPILGEFARFIPVGGISVLIDFLVYFLLLAFSVTVPSAKVTSFIAGSVWSFLGNRQFTFRTNTTGLLPITMFGLVYLLTLGVNTFTNSAVLNMLPDDFKGSVIAAFVVATGLSAVLNFVGLKYLVFRKVSEK